MILLVSFFMLYFNKRETLNTIARPLAQLWLEHDYVLYRKSTLGL